MRRLTNFTYNVDLNCKDLVNYHLQLEFTQKFPKPKELAVKINTKQASPNMSFFEVVVSSHLDYCQNKWYDE